MARSGKGAAKHSQLRIIGGQWRGRKLLFTPAQGLRPTTDRVRETLFNWLAPFIHEARCLDLFAGSGALGLEAISRGAASCEFIDTSSASLQQIRLHLETLLATPQGRCHPGTARQFLQSTGDTYDIVFVDPPFSQNLINPSCALLAARPLLAEGALVYVETATSEEQPLVPADWQLHRQKIAGGVAYRLYTTGEGKTA